MEPVRHGKVPPSRPPALGNRLTETDPIGLPMLNHACSIACDRYRYRHQVPERLSGARRTR